MAQFAMFFALMASLAAPAVASTNNPDTPLIFQASQDD